MKESKFLSGKFKDLLKIINEWKQQYKVEVIMSMCYPQNETGWIIVMLEEKE